MAIFLLGVIRSFLTRKLLIELFLLLANEAAKYSDNQIDDKIVDLVTRAAHGELDDDDQA